MDRLTCQQQFWAPKLPDEKQNILLGTVTAGVFTAGESANQSTGQETKDGTACWMRTLVSDW